AQYNGAYQFFKIAEKEGLLKNPIWKAAFEQVMEELFQKKYQTFVNLDIAGAYHGLQKMTGTRPAVKGDEYLSEFFLRKLEPDPTVLTGEKSTEQAKVLEFLRRSFAQIDGVKSDQFTLSGPPVAPGTSARIYIISDVQSGKKVAVMKIQRGL